MVGDHENMRTVLKGHRVSEVENYYLKNLKTILLGTRYSISQNHDLI